METNLIEFHKSCKNEFYKILEKFNLLFYGYGCKRSLIQDMFPDSLIYDVKIHKINDIVKDLLLNGLHKKGNVSLYEIDNAQDRRLTSPIIVLINFDFDLIDLTALKNIRIIGTIEDIDFKFTYKDIIHFNFILRDLTTFANYLNEDMDIGITLDNVSNVLMVLESVPVKTQKIFKAFASLKNCALTKLYDEVKVPLMITNKNVIMESLKEFIENGVIKLKKPRNLILNLNREEYKKLLELDAYKTI